MLTTKIFAHREFNFKQLLLKVFFHIIGIFHSVQHLSESTFLQGDPFKMSHPTKFDDVMVL